MKGVVGDVPPAPLPFPDSLCHRCAAPPRYVRTETSVFILCPLLTEKYPRQPVHSCPLFRPQGAPPDGTPPGERG
jgi:hypothetical protein